MKHKIIGILVCILLIATAVPAVTSLKNNAINTSVPSHPLTGMGGIWTQEAKLLASDGATGNAFGQSVCIDGDIAIVGIPFDDDTGPGSGSAYIFTRSGTTWSLEQKLLPSDGSSGNHFGQSVSIDGDTVLIGAYHDYTGSVYVFVRSGTTWTQQAKLLASDGEVNDYFGVSVSIDGDSALIGAYWDNDNGDYSGSAYVFTRSGTTWTQQAKLLASDGVEEDQFGISVSLSGESALIGSFANAAGSAYVFTRSGTTWTQQAKLLASDGELDDEFGVSVSLDGDSALIGAWLDDDNGHWSGSAYVFTRSGTIWTQQAKLLASDGVSDDYFGVSVSIDGDSALIGAYWDNDNGDYSGSAYVFTRSGTTWTQQAKLLALDGSPGALFGKAVSIQADTALISVQFDSQRGCAYVFRKIPNQPPYAVFSWIPQNPATNESITFDASASYDTDGNITLYEWDWDHDGIYDEVYSTPYATHSWAHIGTYPVTLQITDNASATTSITKNVSVNNTINLTIEFVNGLGVKLQIRNNGTTTVSDVSWMVHVEGGVFGRINRTIMDTIDIPASETVSVGTGLFFGLGPISITANVSGKEVTAEGTYLFIFSIIK